MHSRHQTRGSPMQPPRIAAQAQTLRWDPTVLYMADRRPLGPIAGRQRLRVARDVQGVPSEELAKCAVRRQGPPTSPWTGQVSWVPPSMREYAPSFVPSSVVRTNAQTSISSRLRAHTDKLAANTERPQRPQAVRNPCDPALPPECEHMTHRFVGCVQESRADVALLAGAAAHYIAVDHSRTKCIIPSGLLQALGGVLRFRSSYGTREHGQGGQ
ncbi:hypothetical protein L227DRAFT_436060 [Lentinus tigrinus ALCF2SS1-6]|uniref:Uncharacterized protein n=1 Tax=Lentinus tigrinus ALCF2SS1-6 TaxID=1328759 RepID=A0A5C2SG45_9APHY|nr:hypothetical protein L227DRAFT_436060 [Lentinus tigrinus ALCF2SS1-6]